MPCHLTWEHEDPDGHNWLGRAGTFEFEIDFEFEPGYAPVFFTNEEETRPSAPKVTFLNTVCLRVHFDDDGETERLPTQEEEAVLERWFEQELANRSELKSTITEHCVNLVNFEADWDDLDD